VRASLLFYRVLAYVVGVGLIILVLVGVPLKYLADQPGVVEVVGPMHGFLYMVYLVATVNLAFRARWSPVKTVLVMLAGMLGAFFSALTRLYNVEQASRADASKAPSNELSGAAIRPPATLRQQ